MHMRFRFSCLLVFCFVFHVSAQDFAALQSTLLKFYAYQRAGLSGNQNPNNPFYTTSPYPHSNDAHNGSDLTGGWYDAGDFVKFGLPQGFTIYTLLKGYDVFPRGYRDEYGNANNSAADGIPDILNQTKYATDYLIKAVISDNSVVQDMGLASQDHQSLYESGYQNWDRVRNRTAVMANGADIAGIYSASLALMSMLYREHDAAYADLCLQKAKEAFDFGLNNRKISTPQTKGGTPMYTSKAWQDKMALAGVELYRATNEDLYMEWALEWTPSIGSHFHVVGYDHVGDYVAFELNRLGRNALSPWMADINLILSRVVDSPQASSLIRGAFISADWGNCGNAGNAAFAMALAFMTTGNEENLEFAINQVKWVAGLSPFTKSFIVGYNNGPTQPHHRNDATIGGLVGSVVSGPAPQGGFDINNPENSNWVFTDNRETFANTEPAINYNAGMVGALAFILDYQNPPPGLVRISKGLVSAKDPLDLNAGPQTLTATFESSQAWTIQLTGAVSEAVKTFTGTGTNVNISWNGEADQGSFLAGESVTARVVSDDIAPYHQARSQTSFFLLNFAKEPFREADQLVDDFEDGDLTNGVNGVWTSFNDGGGSYTSPATLSPAAAITPLGGDSTPGLRVRLVGKEGADHPHAGIRTTFTPDSQTVSLGEFTSIVFDVKVPSPTEPLRVELEQPSITDGAYYGAEVPLGTDLWMRVRLPVSSLAQPDWKTETVPLQKDALKALRFTYYGTSNISITIDNIHIENLEIGGDVQSVRGENQVAAQWRWNGSELSYQLPPAFQKGAWWDVRVVDLRGQPVFENVGMQPDGQGRFIIDLPRVSPGLYFLQHTGVDSDVRWARKFLVP